ncbi:MAG TPA: SIS domain-containing protein [Actinomycetota bacterium]|nr:SIS domain-containing protein [Actinomycetota bacterium]
MTGVGELEGFVREQYAHREALVRSHYAAEAPRLARACHQMAERFARGGRILAFGLGAAATDAAHISVEFVHPVIVGKRALPAIALPNDGPTTLGLATEDIGSTFARLVEVLGEPEDIAIGLSLGPDDPSEPAIAAGLKQAAARGMLTIGLVGASSQPASRSVEADWVFSCDDPDPFVVQEVHETGYHMLWELVHVFFEHKGLLKGRSAGPVHDSGASSFLYPFLAEAETDLDSVLEGIQGSIRQKAEDVISIRGFGERTNPASMVRVAHLLADRFAAGGKLLAFGNGGSATDAQDFVTDLMAPPRGLRPRPALSLTNEEAVVTAVGNDVGYDNVFARQVIAYGKAGDIAFAISTSGGSRNVLAALEEARRRKLTCFGLAGYGGGPMLARGLVEECLTIDFEYIPRIQEAQATQYHVLRRLIEQV